MQFLDLTLDSPAANLALDEALLASAEAAAEAEPAATQARSVSDGAPPTAVGSSPREILRLWEPREFMVVVGSSSRLADEVHLGVCHERHIEVLRRSSGGAAILTGPGSLMYALVLDRRKRPELRGIDSTHAWVLGTLAAAIGQAVPGVERRGISDLAVRDRKFSGNSLRVRRHWLLYHGTLLYGFPIRMLDVCLGNPPRQPDYRLGRRHSMFVRNLHLDAATLRKTVREAFGAADPATDWPAEMTAELTAKKFGNAAWTNRL